MSWTSSIGESSAHAPRHPGEALADELAAAGVSVAALARGTGIAPSLLADIMQGRRIITADTALRLATYFGTSARVWLDRQAAYELVARHGATTASPSRSTAA